MRLIDVDEFIRVASTTELLEGNRWIRRKVLDIIEAFPTIPRLTPEEQRYIELGKSVEAAYLCGGCVLLDGMEPFDTTEEVLDWYRKEGKE